MICNIVALAWPTGIETRDKTIYVCTDPRGRISTERLENKTDGCIAGRSRNVWCDLGYVKGVKKSCGIRASK